MKLVLAEFPDGKALVGDDQGNTSIVSQKLSAILGPLNRFLADRLEPGQMLRKLRVNPRDGMVFETPIFEQLVCRTTSDGDQSWHETSIRTEVVQLQRYIYQLSRRRAVKIECGYGPQSRQWMIGEARVLDEPNPNYQTHPHLEPYVPEICRALGCYYRLDAMDTGFWWYQLSHDDREYLQITDVMTMTLNVIFREAAAVLAQRAHPDAA